jgi:hypothetical protein
MKRLLGIGVVWLGCAMAWMILGSTLVVRSGEATSSVTEEVHSLWGPPGTQHPPSASWQESRNQSETVTVTNADGTESTRTVERQVMVAVPAPLEASEIDVTLELEHRRRGLLWFATFGVDFDGAYTFSNPSDRPREVTIIFPLRASYEVSSAMYDGFSVRRVDANAPEVSSRIEGMSAVWTETFAPGERRTYRITYLTRATDQWRYQLSGEAQRVRDFRLHVTTNFDDIDFPTDGISPSRQDAQSGLWSGEWAFESLITDRAIGIVPPQRLNPGPLAARITYFAPVGLLFFCFVVGIFAKAREVSLHPMHFFFIGCAFFAFHLSFAYLIDHLEIAPSFAISSVTSMFLVVSYARLFVGWKFAVREIGVPMILYLVLFSYTFMWEGFTGLSITVGAIMTLFVMMQVTGRLDWGAASTRSA